jgi:D-aspartate ligase
MATAPAYVLGGHEAGLAVIRSLGAAGVPVVSVWHDPQEMARHSRHLQASIRFPHPWFEPDRYTDSLLDLAEHRGRGLLIPTTDESVTVVAQAKERLETRHAVACPSWTVAERFLDKRLTYELAEELDIAIPPTVIARSLKELEGLAGELLYPCVLKPRLSHLYRDAFGIKGTKARNLEELIAAWRQSDTAGIGTVIQEFVPGPESGGANYNAYLVDGEPVLEFTSRKLRLWPRDLGYPTVVVSERVPEVLAAGRLLLQGMGMSGFANVEFKRDVRDGSYALMEVNGRPNMSGLLSVRCGPDFPLVTYSHLMRGQRPADWTEGPQKEGVYWINEAADPIAAAARLRMRRTSAREQIEPYLRPHVFATASASDPAPALQRLRSKLRAVLGGPGAPVAPRRPPAEPQKVDRDVVRSV